MNEVLKPLYKKVEKILKGEDVGTINIGVSDAFNQVSKEFIGYNCFGEVIFNALLNKLEDTITRYREQKCFKPEEVFVANGNADNDIDIAYELSQVLFPEVFCLVHDKGEGVLKTIDAMWAFVPCDEYALNSIFETLGETFKSNYCSFYADNVPSNTEKLYENIVEFIPF